MINKEFIPYQESLELKELGFDEPCIGKFYYNQLEIGGIWTNNDFKEDPDIFISAPLYQQAFRWFREKYKIRFIIQSSMSDLGEYFKVIFPNGEQRNVSYNTYEEAELACIKQLIEIVKNQ